MYYTRDLILAYWLATRCKPLYYEIHTLPDTPSTIYRSVWKKVSGIITISAGLKKQLVAWGVDEKKIQVANDAVDIKQFQLIESKQSCREKLNLPLTATIIVYTGHLYEWKGASLLAEAASLVPPEMQIYLVGGTAKDSAHFKAIYQAANLRIIGWQPHELIPYWDKAADVLVLPTSGKEKIGALYTSPLKLFEYLVTDAAIVAARLPSVQASVNTNEVIFFEPDNVVDLARAIREAVLNPPTRTNLTQAHTWEERAEIIINFIRKT